MMQGRTLECLWQAAVESPSLVGKELWLLRALQSIVAKITVNLGVLHSLICTLLRQPAYRALVTKQFIDFLLGHRQR